MRVLHLLPELGAGGAERVVCGLAEHHASKGMEITVAPLFEAGAAGLQHRLDAAGVSVRPLGKRSGFDWRMPGRIRELIKEVDPEVIHSHLYALRYALPVLPKSTVAMHTVHNIAEREVGPLDRWLFRRAFRRRVTAVAVAEQVAVTLRKAYGPGKYPVIPNGVPLTHLRASAASRRKARSALGVGDSDVLLLAVGRLAPQKRPLELLTAFSRGLSAELHTRLAFAGVGDLAEALSRRVAELGLSKRVHLLGHVEEMGELLAASDLFVSASLWEGNPLALMEAMVMGKAPVATRVGGVGELVESGVDGLLVDADSPQELELAIRSLALDSKMRSRLGAAAADKAEGFSDAQTAAAYLRLYRDLLGAQEAADVG